MSLSTYLLHRERWRFARVCGSASVCLQGRAVCAGCVRWNQEGWWQPGSILIYLEPPIPTPTERQREAKTEQKIMNMIGRITYGDYITHYTWIQDAESFGYYLRAGPDGLRMVFFKISAQSVWPSLILQPMRLLAHYLHSLVQCSAQCKLVMQHGIRVPLKRSTSPSFTCLDLLYHVMQYIYWKICKHATFCSHKFHVDLVMSTLNTIWCRIYFESKFHK